MYHHPHASVSNESSTRCCHWTRWCDCVPFHILLTLSIIKDTHLHPGWVTRYPVRLIFEWAIFHFSKEENELNRHYLGACHIGKKVGFPWHMRDNVGHTTPGWTGLDIILRPTKDCPNGHSFQQDGVIVWPSRIRSITTLVIKTRASGLFHFKPHVLTKRCCWANIFHIDAIAK